MTDQSRAEPVIEVVAGAAFARLGNAVSDAINAALVGGMDVDEACSVAVGVVGDYWRQAYPLDDSAIAGLAAVLRGKQN